MTEQEYNNIKYSDDLITIDDLSNKNARTLLYGYLCNRSTFHVYIKDKKIVAVYYGYKEKPELWGISCNRSYVPDKRLYPECCDYEFCLLLSRKGISLPFTTPDFSRAHKKYYGETI